LRSRVPSGRPEAHCSFPASFPHGIYTIPEISFAGATEEELTEQKGGV
jgi:pyruvate/2-oxoglutarate dehydrogenase complex dihydrolipoamide dehydrogenase (E3) component